MAFEFKDLVPALKKLVIDESVKLVMRKLIEWTSIKGVSFLTWPVFGPVTSYVVTQIMTYLIEETVIGLSLLWIMVDLQYEVASAEAAADRLKEMIENPERFTAAQMKEIEENFDDTAAELIHIALVKY